MEELEDLLSCKIGFDDDFFFLEGGIVFFTDDEFSDFWTEL
jgi:hypothetical protein